MRKAIKVLAAVVAVILMLVFVSACNGKDDDDEILVCDITIQFDTGGGDIIEDISFSLFSDFDGFVSPNPTRAGYIFEGWFLDSDFEGEITADLIENFDPTQTYIITLYAKWSFDYDYYTEDYFETRISLINTIYGFESDDAIDFDEVYLTEGDEFDYFINLVMEDMDADINENDFSAVLTVEEYGTIIIMKNADVANILYDKIIELIEGEGVVIGEDINILIRGNLVSFFFMFENNIVLDQIYQDGDTYYIENGNNMYILRYTGEANTFDIPSSYRGKTVVGIEANAFAECESLIVVNIPATIITIGAYAFMECTSLSSITIPNTVTTIRSSAFSYCDGLVINCQAPIKPEGWQKDWVEEYAFSEITVNWGVGLTKVTYSFVTNGGSPVANINAIALQTQPITTKADWYLVGWYDNAALEGEPITFPYYNPSNVTLYAAWTDELILDGTTFLTAFIAEEDIVYDVNITSGGQYVYFSFTPETTGSYNIQSYGSMDTYGYLYNSLYYQINYNDDGDYDLNFKMVHTLQAGSTYYIGIKLFSADLTGSFTFEITNMNIPEPPVQFSTLLPGLINDIDVLLGNIWDTENELYSTITFFFETNGMEMEIELGANLGAANPDNQEIIIRVYVFEDNIKSLMLGAYAIGDNIYIEDYSVGDLPQKLKFSFEQEGHYAPLASLMQSVPAILSALLGQEHFILNDLLGNFLPLASIFDEYIYVIEGEGDDFSIIIDIEELIELISLLSGLFTDGEIGLEEIIDDLLYDIDMQTRSLIDTLIFFVFGGSLRDIFEGNIFYYPSIIINFEYDNELLTGINIDYEFDLPGDEFDVAFKAGFRNFYFSPFASNQSIAPLDFDANEYSDGAIKIQVRFETADFIIDAEIYILALNEDESVTIGATLLINNGNYDVDAYAILDGDMLLIYFDLADIFDILGIEESETKYFKAIDLKQLLDLIFSENEFEDNQSKALAMLDKTMEFFGVMPHEYSYTDLEYIAFLETFFGISIEENSIEEILLAIDISYGPTFEGKGVYLAFTLKDNLLFIFEIGLSLVYATDAPPLLSFDANDYSSDLTPISQIFALYYQGLLAN